MNMFCNKNFFSCFNFSSLRWWRAMRESSCLKNSPIFSCSFNEGKFVWIRLKSVLLILSWTPGVVFLPTATCIGVLIIIWYKNSTLFFDDLISTALGANVIGLSNSGMRKNFPTLPTLDIIMSLGCNFDFVRKLYPASSVYNHGPFQLFEASCNRIIYA